MLRALGRACLGLVIVLSSCGDPEGTRRKGPSGGQREFRTERQTSAATGTLSGRQTPPGEDKSQNDWAPEKIEARVVFEDVFAVARKQNSSQPPPLKEFRAGSVEPDEFSGEVERRADGGFVIQMPGHLPVPTPTVDEGRLFVSGGFGTREYYCFDAETGEPIWGIALDDDGPSSPVVSERTVLFNTESCTLYAVDAQTGALRWAHWLGDPVMSIPAVANGHVYTVYPGVENGDVSVLDTSPEIPEDLEVENPEKTLWAAAKKFAASSLRRMRQVIVLEPLKARPADAKPNESIEYTHVAVCFDLATGRVVWQHWIDTECMSAPVIAGDEVVFSTFAGTIYRFDFASGRLAGAWTARATSVPVVAAGRLLYTCRSDESAEPEAVRESVVALGRNQAHPTMIATSQRAPYLDWRVQIDSKLTQGANKFDGGIGGGGFGGGFFFVPGEQPEHTDSADTPPADDDPADDDTAMVLTPQQELDAALGGSAGDLLAITQRQAALVVGRGNISTLQGYEGSRILVVDNRIYSCLGDRIICLDSDTGKEIWSHVFSGDLEQEGGHLASSPIAAGNYILVASLAGDVLQFDAASGEVRQRYPVSAPLRFAPIVSEGRIYVGTQDGKLVCINTGDPALDGWPTWGRSSGHDNLASSP